MTCSGESHLSHIKVAALSKGYTKQYVHKALLTGSNTSVQRKLYQWPHQLSAASLGTVTNLHIHLHKLYKNECIKLYLSVLISSLI